MTVKKKKTHAPEIEGGKCQCKNFYFAYVPCHISLNINNLNWICMHCVSCWAFFATRLPRTKINTIRVGIFDLLKGCNQTIRDTEMREKWTRMSEPTYISIILEYICGAYYAQVKCKRAFLISSHCSHFNFFFPDDIELNVNRSRECNITKKKEKWLTLIWLAFTPVRDETHSMFVLHFSVNVENADNSSISFILNGAIFT